LGRHSYGGLLLSPSVEFQIDSVESAPASFGVIIYGTIPGGSNPEDRESFRKAFIKYIESGLAMVDVQLDQLFFRSKDVAWTLERDLKVEEIRRQLAEHRHPRTDPCKNQKDPEDMTRCLVARALWGEGEQVL
jgi:hypothetical protein